MCYAIPGKVTSISDKTVFVDYFGEEKKAYNDFYDLSPGDYVYAQGGYVVQKILPVDAEEILSVWKESFFSLQETDLAISRLALSGSKADAGCLRILDKVTESLRYTNEDLLYLLGLENEECLGLLRKSGNFLRQKYMKNSCCVHGIIEISNYCSRGCFYCGISSYNGAVPRYSMSNDEIFAAASEAVLKYGFRSLVLQSGEDAGLDFDGMAEVVRKIREELGALIFVSFGEIGVDGLKKLYDAGSRGLLMRFESSNPMLYRRVCPGHTLEGRLEHIKQAYSMGYLIITGALIGIPGQSPQDILNDIYLAKDLNAEMFSFGPFIPHSSTPLASYPPPKEEDILKVIALLRIVNPRDARILVTTAFETLSSEARRNGLLSGANSVMLNVTPLQYRKLYSIYPGRAHEDEPIEFQVGEVVALLKSLGRAPSDLGAGH